MKEARREAISNGCDVLIVDTAGRLHIDEQLMDEMQSLKKMLNPQEILFVADSMTGQDAVRSADEFHKKLTLTGVVLTKMDGDARGGAALSIRNVTGQPIKFIGVGEKYDALEPFHPDRIVGRILGMGDILSLIEKAEATLDKKKSEEFAAKALSHEGFSLEDFRDQLRQVKKLGSIKSIMGMMPKIGPFANMQKAADNVDEKELNRVEAIINSMTPLRARASRGHQRQPPQAHRPRLRHQRAGSEPTPPPVRPDAQDVQGHGQAQLRPPHGRHENAGDVRKAATGRWLPRCNHGLCNHIRHMHLSEQRMNAQTEEPTPASMWRALAGSPMTDDLLEWPADLFALTDVILGRSEVYRFILSPAADMEWPPRRFSNWSDAVQETSRQWSLWIEDRQCAFPDLLAEEWGVFCEGAGGPFEHLAEGRDWRLCEALLTLHAIADEACAGLGVALDKSEEKACLYRAHGRELLARTGSLARIPAHFLCVLPKIRTPSHGTSLR